MPASASVCVCVCVYNYYVGKGGSQWLELRTVYHHVFSFALCLYVFYLFRGCIVLYLLFFVLNVQSCKVVGMTSGVG